MAEIDEHFSFKRFEIHCSCKKAQRIKHRPVATIVAGSVSVFFSSDRLKSAKGGVTRPTTTKMKMTNPELTLNLWSVAKVIQAQSYSSLMFSSIHCFQAQLFFNLRLSSQSDNRPKFTNTLPGVTKYRTWLIGKPDGVHLDILTHPPLGCIHILSDPTVGSVHRAIALWFSHVRLGLLLLFTS